MDNIFITGKDANMSEYFVSNVNHAGQNSIVETQANPLIESLIQKGGEKYFNYLKRLGLSLKSDILILSSRQHYYYDHDDLKGVKLLINIKKLNYIKHLDSFLHVVSRMLPHSAIFIGSFSNRYLIKRKEFQFNRGADILSGFINYLNSGHAGYLNENILTRMLESHGFKVLDMTESDGETYFSTSREDQLTLTKIFRPDFS